MENENPPVLLGDLRPHLRNLNWQLRRIGLSVIVTIGANEAETTNDFESNIVTDVHLENQNRWTITCDKCKHVFSAGTAQYPKCPECGTLEMQTTENIISADKNTDRGVFETNGKRRRVIEDDTLEKLAEEWYMQE